jgi:hypothetical protein
MHFFRKHIIEQPFIFATGLAALLHSTWALGTFFAGVQPDTTNLVQLVGWLLPAGLIAFALDVGQITTAAEIRRAGLTAPRGATFLVLAVATYYLQWLYMAHHMPALALAPGVRESWGQFATLMRDAAVWIIPMLLPLSTLLYTFSGSGHEQQPMVAQTVAVPVAPMIEIKGEDKPKLNSGDDLPFGHIPPEADDTEPIETTPSDNGHTGREKKR